MLDDGRPLRSVSAPEWFTRELGAVLRPWAGYGLLMLIPRRGAHSVWLFWHDDGSFRGWYVNLEQPHVWHAGGCDTRDELLDITCDEPRRWSWKDGDELEAAIEAGVLGPREGDRIRAEGRRVAELIEQWDSPFADGWETWRPAEGWLAPRLAPDWART